MEGTVASFMNELEHLQELDHDELKRLSERVSEFRKRVRK